MSRSMPWDCEHGVTVDWGDFGPHQNECPVDYAAECTECYPVCEQCAAESRAIIAISVAGEVVLQASLALFKAQRGSSGTEAAAARTAWAEAVRTFMDLTEKADARG